MSTVAELLHDLVFDYTLRTIALGAAVLGVSSGVLGTFAVLRRQSLLGDALAHAALPGICLAYMATGSKAPVVLMVGAGVAGWLGALLLLKIVATTSLDEDAALGIVLASFFGFGIVLLTVMQKRPDAGQAGLDKFLFGQAAALVGTQVAVTALLGTAAIAVVIVLYKELKVLCFDPTFARTTGLAPRWLEVLVTSLVVVAVVIGLQTVGVVLMASMLVGPVVAARQWSDRLAVVLVLAGAIGAGAGVTGAVVSVAAERVPTGPAIILSLTVFALVSILFAPRRGVVPDAVRRRRRGLVAPVEVEAEPAR
ncbi:MAG: metal ABC transporter permease [Ardenticatenales bacterium]|nr:metal ABC transporter permease [Ardenticatenales bacterium]